MGGQVALADAIGVSQAAVWKWLKGKVSRISWERAMQIEQATGGKVTQHR